MTDANDVPQWVTVAANKLVSTMRYAQKEGTHYPESEEVDGFSQLIYAAYLASASAPQPDALAELGAEIDSICQTLNWEADRIDEFVNNQDKKPTRSLIGAMRNGTSALPLAAVIMRRESRRLANAAAAVRQAVTK